MSNQIKKPKVKLSGSDGNVFFMIGKCASALKKEGMGDKAKEMSSRCFECDSYGAAITVMSEYCDIQ